jgi:hypothetical protein
MYSNRPSQFYLKWIGARESYTEPEALYKRLKKRGMDLVTITDHDTEFSLFIHPVDVVVTAVTDVFTIHGVDGEPVIVTRWVKPQFEGIFGQILGKIHTQGTGSIEPG